MRLVFDQKQQEAIDKIRQRFESKYKLDYCVDGISICISNKIYTVKLYLNIQYVTHDMLMVCVNNNTAETHVMTVDGEYLYLDTIQDMIDNVYNQLCKYTTFISEYVEEYTNEYDDSVILDLVEGKLYLYGKVVIGPMYDINNDENYCAFFINSLTGKYPMKRFTSISYSDLRSCIEFFL